MEVKMKVNDFDYDLPSQLIAQKPLKNRSDSRLMVINKSTEKISDIKFNEILYHLSSNDVLVINNTKVIPARLIGYKKSGAKIEIFLLKKIEENIWECLVKPGKRLKKDQNVYFENDLNAKLLNIKDNGNRVLKFECEKNFEQILNEIGEAPLPPYIKEKLENIDRYQTVYAKKGESVAAPTAGLHFTDELLKKIKQKGIDIIEINLEVGLGTFRPIKSENILEHEMHEEKFEITKENAQKINDYKKNGKKIIAVGTTSLRALESSCDENKYLIGQKSETNIFIYPGYEFKIVDGLITNFHLPKSTLLLLVCAFSNKNLIMKAYEKAIKEQYRFFSFGDAMFLR